MKKVKEAIMRANQRADGANARAMTSPLDKKNLTKSEHKKQKASQQNNTPTPLFRGA